jgi:hypothetical protein
MPSAPLGQSCWLRCDISSTQIAENGGKQLKIDSDTDQLLQRSILSTNEVLSSINFTSAAGSALGFLVPPALEVALARFIEDEDPARQTTLRRPSSAGCA